MLSKYIKCLFLGLCLMLPVQAAEIPFFDETFGDFSEELKHAQAQGKAGVLSAQCTE